MCFGERRSSNRQSPSLQRQASFRVTLHSRIIQRLGVALHTLDSLTCMRIPFDGLLWLPASTFGEGKDLELDSFLSKVGRFLSPIEGGFYSSNRENSKTTYSVSVYRRHKNGSKKAARLPRLFACSDSLTFPAFAAALRNPTSGYFRSLLAHPRPDICANAVPAPL